MASRRGNSGGAPFKVFGIGLNRTGTNTLRVACRRLGFRAMRRDPALARAWRAGDLDRVLAATEQFDAFDDWPWPLMVPELLAHFGDRARFVLTVRATPERWLESVRRHALRSRPGGAARARIFGYAYPDGAEDAYLDVYRAHIEGVRARFRAAGAEALLAELCWETGDGWEALCGFLGLPVPDMPFPHRNRAGSTRIDPDIEAANRRLIARQLRRLGRSG